MMYPAFFYVCYRDGALYPNVLLTNFQHGTRRTTQAVWLPLLDMACFKICRLCFRLGFLIVSPSYFCSSLVLEEKEHLWSVSACWFHCRSLKECAAIRRFCMHESSAYFPEMGSRYCRWCPELKKEGTSALSKMIAQKLRRTADPARIFSTKCLRRWSYSGRSLSGWY